MSLGTVSVIIPTRDRPEDLRRCLRALADCNTALLAEVIVVDDGSHPYVVDPGPSTLPVTVLRQPRSTGATAARAAGVEQATGDVLAFLDDDALPRNDWLDVIVDALSEDVAAITGRVLPFDAGLISQARQARYQQRYQPLHAGDPVGFFAGGNSAVWRKIFLDVGGMPQRGPGSDNSLVPNLERAGLHVHFVPTLVIVHRNGKGVITALREAYGAGRTHPEPLPLRTVLRQAARPGAGDRAAVRLTNSLLNVAHLVGRHRRLTSHLKPGAVA